MEIFKIIGTLISFILIMIGVIAIYDARKLTEKWFSFYDRNSATKWIKLGGYLIAIIGALALFFINK